MKAKWILVSKITEKELAVALKFVGRILLKDPNGRPPNPGTEEELTAAFKFIAGVLEPETPTHRPPNPGTEG